MKRGGGRRYYRPDDVDLLRGVRHLLYGQGYTIRGVQRILREQSASFVQDVWRAGAQPPPPELEEDRAGDPAFVAADKAPIAARTEPKLLAIPASRAPSHAASLGERREPTLEAPGALAPPLGVTDDDRHKLQSALDELVACRGIIDAALRQS